MRASLNIVMAGSLLVSGCSAYIADAGYDISRVSSREMAHAEFGLPKKIETVEGQVVEHYRTRRKLHEIDKARVECTLAALSLGSSEVVFLPLELYLLGRRTLWGQDFRIYYHLDGSIDHIYVDNNGDDYILGSIGKIKPCPSITDD